ncbi:MAG: hypothetical protein A2428_10570 [Bdellovibrionales bacterium RIFOXYC1_FULL_54_43]|nr:MAG: hypothetical protein A2428_10570 [Bdellovibrionales bacterium RIFOXYC1_FULL_54_43]OFZ81994.1 MAG: hypothetical protein A2603_08650 [Bdellovibrionales bacterium RIFOXYD1_FULL_55_31]
MSSKMICKNPATGEILRELDPTPVELIPELFVRSRKAQILWAALPPKKRAERLKQIRETLLNHTDELIELITQENGKPRLEALSSELLPSLELLTYFAKKGPGILRDTPLPLRLMKHRKSYLNHFPYGVVAILSPWNYPFLLPFSDIMLALLAGNSVIFKPSERAPLVGLRIQELCDESGLPQNLLQTVIGDDSVGAAVITAGASGASGPDKIFFTGNIENGKKILRAAAETVTPVSLELGGKNAIIVLPDADIEYATSAIVWGAFTNSGQVCAATSRAFVHEKIIDAVAARVAEKLSSLRQAPSSQYDNDLGPITLESQKAIYSKQLDEARNRGATIVCGGNFSQDRVFLEPTVLRTQDTAGLSVFTDETFGPILAISAFKSPADAVEQANRGHYGLTASIITKNLSLGEEIAKQLHVGTVMLNEVVYTAGLPEVPWGGVKRSGMGRAHSECGLLEFVNLRHIHKPRSRLFIFKSLWWFPYTPHQFMAFRKFADLYRNHWTDKIRAFPHFLIHLVHFLKREKRL